MTQSSSPCLPLYLQKLADSVIVTQPVKSNMAVLLHVEGLQEQAAEKVLAALPAGVLLAPGTCGDNTWGAEDAGAGVGTSLVWSSPAHTRRC
jgi:hypothetical protein